MKLLGFEEVKARTGLSRTTLWRYERDGTFPARRQVGPNRVAWLESEVDAFIEGLPTASGGDEGSEAA